MINVSTITGSGGLYQRLGWRVPTKVGYTDLVDAANKVSNSGLYFQSYHPFVTIENIKSCQPDASITTLNFNAYLLNLQKDVILKVINAVFKGRDDVLEEGILYDHENVITKTIDNGTDFVGYEITLAKLADIVAKINTLIGEFDGVATFTIYLYHSSQQTALKTQEIITVANSAKLQIPTSEWALLYDTSTYKGGKFYVGYYQADLGSVKALNRNWSNASVQNRMSHLGMLPIKVTPNGVSLFDLAAVQYTGDTYGLNFDISVHRDFTQTVLDNKQLFDDVIGLGMAVEVLNLIYCSGRSNLAERVAKEFVATAYNELYGSPDIEEIAKSKGVIKELYIEIRRIKKALFGKDKIKTVTAR